MNVQQLNALTIPDMSIEAIFGWVDGKPDEAVVGRPGATLCLVSAYLREKLGQTTELGDLKICTLSSTTGLYVDVYVDVDRFERVVRTVELPGNTSQLVEQFDDYVKAGGQQVRLDGVTAAAAKRFPVFQTSVAGD